MDTATSRDGTLIAFDHAGAGSALILVSPALNDRNDMAPLAAALASRMAVYSYDRRGRGDSGDNQPYAVEREIEDLAAMIDVCGGHAHVFGHSSGAALALEAALAGLAIERMAVYEPPYIVDDSRPPVPDDYLATLTRLAAGDKRAETVEYFWRVALLMPPQAIEGAKHSPYWPGLLKVANTLPYDAAVMRDHMTGKPLPPEWHDRLTMRVLAIDGEQSAPALRNAVAALTELLPNARRRTLVGMGHGAPPDVLAPVLEEFFLG